MIKVFQSIWIVSFWTFIAVKLAGVSFADWSWWWVLMPQIPIVSLVTRGLGL